MSDKVIISANAYSGSKDVTFSVVRYGNVAANRGFLIPFYYNLVNNGSVASIPPTFQIYEKATIPEMKAGPSRAKLCIIAAAASFFFSILLPFIVDYLKWILKDKKIEKI